MNISSSELKSLLKKVSGSKGENLTLSTASGEMIVFDGEVLCHVLSESLMWPSTPFSVSVPLRKFSQIVNRMSGQISINWKNSALEIKSNRATVSLETTKDKAPPLKELPLIATLPIKAVQEILKFAAQGAEVNRASNYGGVVQLGEREAAATNGTKLHVASYPDFNGFLPLNILIPLGAVAAIQNLEGETLEIGESETQLYFHAGQVSVFAGKLAKDYPDWRNFIPASFASVFQFDADAAVSGLRIVETAAGQDRAVHLNFLDGMLKFSSVGAGDQASDYIEYQLPESDPFDEAPQTNASVNLHIDYVLDFLSSVKGPVDFKITEKRDRVLASSGNKSVLWVAMA